MIKQLWTVIEDHSRTHPSDAQHSMAAEKLAALVAAEASRSASGTVGRVLLWVLGLFIGGAAIAAMIGGVVLRGLGLLQAAVILGGVGLAIIERL